MEVEDKRSHLRHLRGYIVLGGRRLRRAACVPVGEYTHVTLLLTYRYFLRFLKVLLTRRKSEFALFRMRRHVTLVLVGDFDLKLLRQSARAARLRRHANVQALPLNCGPLHRFHRAADSHADSARYTR